MKTCMLWVSVLVAVALLLPAGFALGQGRMADIEDAKRLLDQNPTFNNRLRLGTLQYLQGVDYLQAGDAKNAIESLQAGVWTLEDGKGMIPETHPVFEEARYGLGYALLRNNTPHEALIVLDQLVTASPDYGKARYLLAVTLMGIPGERSVTRGVSVLTQLAQQGRAPYKEMAERAVARYGYNLSTLPHATGDAAGATAMISGVVSAVGEDKGASAEENVKVRYGQGVYLMDSGDLFGALDHFEAAGALDRNYRLNNGVALAGVMSNTYYAAGIQQLELGGESAAQVAVTMFQGAAETGDANALDVNHGLAVAHTRLGDKETAARALQKIVQRDASYYERIRQR